jgi:hypothetical protein
MTMKDRTLFAVSFLSVVLAIAPVSDATAGDIVKLLPGKLWELARARGCTDVLDYYERIDDDALDPPYVYGYLPYSDRGKSAIFWCERRAGAERVFILQLMVAERSHPAAKCPDQIFKWGDYPGGLSIRRDRETTLDKFIYIDNPRQHGPRGVHMSHNLIVSDKGGTSRWFYCHEGRWLLRELD